MITNVSEFKQRLQSIQQNSSIVYTTLPSSEPRLVIDANSREISIPVEFDFLAVKNDHKAETIYFEIARYFDNIDLSQHTCVIQWTNQSDEGISPCTEMDVDTFDGKIIFGWEITSDCTRHAGTIRFSVRFYTIDEIGNFEYNFNTLPAESKVLDTLNSYGEKEPVNPSTFQVWVDRLYFLEKNCITKEDLEGIGSGGGQGGSGEDGKTPYIQDGYWYIDGVNTGVKAEGVDGEDGKDGAPGQNGVDGKDGVGISSAEVNTDGELVLHFTNETTLNLGKVVGADGKDGVDGENGKDGADGKDGTNGIDGKDGIGIANVTIVDGKLTITLSDETVIDLGNIKGEDGKDGEQGPQGEPGKDGQNGTNGVDGRDGTNGVDGKDGESAYEIWLGAGHSGSESDFLQWLKGDTEPFEDVVTSISCGGIAAGTPLKGKTVKDVLVMLLGVQEAPKSAVENIMTKSIPAHSGTTNGNAEAVEYKLLDGSTANYNEQGFYTETDDAGNITSAGYQLTIDGNSNADAQTVSIPANVVIKMAYRYDLGGTNTWLAYTFDTADEANYWLLGEQFTETVNGEEVVYQIYAYNVEIVGGGDAITSTEYWRFELEVTD